jgi:membrane-associated phospholipid phosphatase
MASEKPYSGTRRLSGSDLFGPLVPLDVATLFYILFSTIYICFGVSRLHDMSYHLLIRAGTVGLIFSLAFLRQKFPNEFVSFFRYLYPLLFLGFFYTETSYLKNIIFEKNLDPFFCDAESGLFGCQPSLEFSKKMPQPWFNELMNLCYFSYYIMTSVLCIIIYFKNRAESFKSIFILIFSFYLYYIIFAIFPVVGPQYHFGHPEAEPHYVFGKIMHYILVNAEEPTGAFPSSHVGIAIITVYIAFKHQKKLFYIFLPFAIGICFATVYLRAHYLVDVFGAIITVPVFISISNLVYNKLYTRTQGSETARISSD